MPYRAYHLVLGVLGLLAVLALVLFGADPDRHTLSGPRWKRRLLTAGLVLLAAFGIGPACKGSTTQKSTAATGNSMAPPMIDTPKATPKTAPKTTPGKNTPKYAATAEWKQLQAALQEAESIASGKRGSYPFSEKGKKQLLADLVTAGLNADVLAKRGLLDTSEAGLLRRDLLLLSSKVSSYRPTEMRMASCYQRIVIVPPAALSYGRLQFRLPLLKKLAAAKQIHPAVVRKVLLRVEAELKVLQTPAKLNKLKPARRAKAKQLVLQVESQLKQLRTRLSSP